MRPESAKRKRERQREYRQQVLLEALALIDELPESPRRNAVFEELGELIDAKDLVAPPVRRPRAKKIPAAPVVQTDSTKSVATIVRREAQYRFP